eukprot:TRINITY_DN4518_c0_g1_i1.p1 TRINITY_DN4518_c0_g1~~TRINITY_DN4518_c0_g1_i1.p1  ORF type:complete len:608 (-),score=135.29 TRINITY_DN4518_c0_g1_i1:95-1876(-)
MTGDRIFDGIPDRTDQRWDSGQRKAEKSQTLADRKWAESNTGDQFAKLAAKNRQAQLEASFRMFDKDGSGQIESSELLSLVHHAFPDLSDSVARVYHDVILREVDCDGDGNVAYRELLTRGDSSQLLKRIFDCVDKAEALEHEFSEMDVDGSGSVDTSELEGLIAKAFPGAGEAMRSRFLHAVLLDCDKDGSGTITMEEFFKSEYFYMLAMADEESVDEPAPQTKTKRTPFAKCAGLGGGMKSRCAELSPRRANEPPLIEVVRTAPPKSPRQKLPVVERYERDNFVPVDPGLNGDVLLAKAEEALAAYSSGHQWNDAREHFQDAADAFEREGRYGKAGEAYIRVADCFGKIGSPIESAKAMVRAAEAFAQVNPEDAIATLNETIDIFEDFKLTKMVGRVYKQIAELYERINNFRDSIDFYLQAADLYEGDEHVATRVMCHKKVAELYARSGLYKDAIQTYELLATTVFENNLSANPVLGRLEVKDFYFRAVLCYLAQVENVKKGIDRITVIERAKAGFERYTDLDIENFNGGLEYNVAKNLIEASLKQDTNLMRNTIADYKAARQVEPWVADLLGRIQVALHDWLEIAGKSAS